METIYYYRSPIACLKLKANENALTGLQIIKDFSGGYDTIMPAHTIIQQTCGQLDEYFSGLRKTFDLPLSLAGTSFQQKVWKALQQIPYGKTISYAQLAQSVDNAKACRAVGSANGKNPVAIIVPCHRVINADGKLGGFACGVEIKKQLLDWEQIFLFF
jgi:methylated-DNA-[protein]-cysteine S-methyltransferase